MGEGGSNSTIFASLFSRGQLLMEIICSFGSKFFPLRVDSIKELHPPSNEANKEFIHIHLTSFFRKEAGVFIRAGTFIRINIQ